MKRARQSRPDLVKAIRQHEEAHRFHPHQIRHTVATEIRKRYGIEAAQVLLGHSTLQATQIYAERDVEAGRRIAAQIG